MSGILSGLFGKKKEATDSKNESLLSVEDKHADFMERVAKRDEEMAKMAAEREARQELAKQTREANEGNRSSFESVSISSREDSPQPGASAGAGSSTAVVEAEEKLTVPVYSYSKSTKSTPLLAHTMKEEEVISISNAKYDTYKAPSA